MLNVKGLDLEDDESDFANRQFATTFPLRPSLGSNKNNKDPKKKKKCC
jgi:hypothetical protein